MVLLSSLLLCFSGYVLSELEKTETEGEVKMSVGTSGTRQVVLVWVHINEQSTHNMLCVWCGMNSAIG